jgi:probable F420-dependent oxidoreductase
LGVGISHAPIVVRSGRTYDRPLDRMATFLDQLQDGPRGVPPTRLLVGANGPKALGLACERAGGAVPYLVTPEHTALARELLGQERLLVPVQKVVLDEDPQRARTLARERLQVYWGFPNYTRNLARMGFDDADLAGGGSDRLIDALVAWGDAASIADRVRLHLDAGADHVAIHVVRSEQDDPVDAWEALAEALR